MAFRSYARPVTPAFVEILPAARLQPYRDYWAEMAGGVPADAASLGALYIWQVTISSSWYEVLCQTEVLVRNVLDSQLPDQRGTRSTAQGPQPHRPP